MFTAEQYARVKELMCKRYSICTKCPLHGHEEMSCRKFVIKYPAEAVKRVELWWMENKKYYPEYQREVK